MEQYAFMRGMALRSSQRWCDIVIYNKKYIFGLLPAPGGASQVAQLVKKLPANAGDIRDKASIPGSGRSLEEEMTPHSSILAWEIPWTEDPGGLQSRGWQRVGCN